MRTFVKKIGMIQRIQTLYYLGAILCLLAIFSFPIIHHQVVEQPKEVLEYTIKRDAWLLISWMLHLTLAVLLFLNIFLYKNIKTQVKLGKLVFVGCEILFLSWLAYYLFCTPIVVSSTIPGIKVSHQLSIGFYFLSLGLILLFLGNRAVKKDKKLLDSLNRLR